MASITQKINSVNGGISQQPDELKVPGQVVSAKNVFPDVTHGLQKRPGSKLIDSLSNGTKNSYTTGKWFSYYRDETEQYIGQVIRRKENDGSSHADDGLIRMWRCSDGQEMHVNGNTGALTTYLQHSNDDDIQTLTLNDTTFINNRTIPTAMATTVEAVQPNQAFVELKQIKYASQYNLDIFNSTATNDLSTVSTATRLGVSYTLGTTYLNARTEGTCDSVGTEVFTVNIAEGGSYVTALDKDGNTISGRGSNLYFRITATGQPTTTGGATPTYVCRYTVKIDMLYGGEGWQTGDVVKVRMKNASSQTDYSVTIEESSTATVSANLSLVRPSPTPFDGETAVTADSILGTLKSEILDSENSIVDPEYVTATTAQTRNIIIITLANHGYSAGDTVDLFWTQSAHYSGSPDNGTFTVLASGASNNIPSVGPTPNTFCVETNDPGNGTFYPNVTYPNGTVAILKNQTAFTATQIGNGLYITRPDSEVPFNINTGASELLNVLTSEVQDVADLPKQCKHGYVVKIRNSANDEDDYYVKFFANNNLSGEGVWEECAKPGRRIEIDKATMPIQLVRTGATAFTLSQVDYDNCAVGDDLTAPEPSFISPIPASAATARTINKMVFFRNRLVFLSDENVIMSRPGDFFNFWPKSAIAASAEDPIDLSCSSEYPAIVYDAIQVNTGLVLFTKNQQFMLTTDSDVLSPITAKINSLSTYNFNYKTNPISLGTTIAFLDNAGKFTRMFEMASVLREGEPLILEQSKVISKLFPKDITLIANSRENSFIVFAAKDGTTLYGYKYFTSGEKRLMQSWITWELTGNIQHVCMLDDSIYAVVRSAGVDVMQRFNLKLSDDTTESITQTDKTYKVYLDNISEIAVSTGTYSTSTNQTTFVRPNGYTSSKQLAVYDIDIDDDLGVYVSKRSDGTSAVSFGGSNNNTLSIDGDWSGHVKTINVTNQGTGYTTAPTVTLSGGGGSGAIATAHIADGKVTSVSINNDGYNYTAIPTITFSGGGGSNAAATATIDDTKFLLGYNYDMEIEFPKFYYTQQSGEKYVTDVQSNLIIHRIKFNFGPLGMYETTLKRVGKTDYNETFESRYADQYAANTLVIDAEQEVTLPIYERNTNYTLTLKSSHPSPATLYSLAWEGDYSSRLYKRV